MFQVSASSRVSLAAMSHHDQKASWFGSNGSLRYGENFSGGNGFGGGSAVYDGSGL